MYEQIGVMMKGSQHFASGWTIVLVDRPEHRGGLEALLCMSGGGFASRAATECRDGLGGDGIVRVSGVYGPEPPGSLASGRTWLPSVSPGSSRRWRLDLCRGIIEHEIEVEGGERLRSLRWSCLARPGVSVFCIDDSPVDLIVDDQEGEPIVLGGAEASATICVVESAASRSVLRVAAMTRRPDEVGTDDARRRAEEACRSGGATLELEQESAWRERWAGAHLAIDGPSRDQLAARFAVYHLLSLATDDGDELAVGPRGLTGSAYAGHVFWDADVYVLPTLAAIAPSASMGVLRYRAHRLQAARDRARAEGRPGARYPWESASSGREMTPPIGTTVDGATVPILTGEQEIHINSDIAWAILHHARWTGSNDFLHGDGATIITETARYLTSRIELDTTGRGHLRGVIGPDEYHETVDDNAFTNVMTRWHLRQASRLTTDPAEADQWQVLADLLVDGYQPGSGRHEQFAGFDALDPTVITAVTEPPVAADLLLGRAAVARSQVLKQADVVMLHHLVPWELPAGSLVRDLAYYLPRTAHGSSLSPAIHASVLARAHRPDEALELLRIALRLDLDDLTGTTAGGVHIATMAGVWQALAFGFLGLAVRDNAAFIDPDLPSDWNELRLCCSVLGRRIELRADHDEVELHADGPICVGWPGADRSHSVDHLRLVGGAEAWRRAT